MANEKTIRTRIQNRHAPESYWVSNNTFVPRAGEIIIYDVDTNHSHPRVKIGDGQTTIVNLPFSDATVLGETADTAYRGDRGKTAYDHAFAKGSAYSSGLYKVTTNEQGHVTNATPVVKKDITDLGVPAQDTTYNDATQTTHGLMSANDKKKLDNAKELQTAVSDPTASGTGVEFISGISQNAQGVISPSKKTVRTMGGASASAAGSTGLVPAPAKGDQGKFLNGAGQWQTPTNTKNTAGSTDSSSKLFLIGATSQAASPQTYSHDTAYIGTDGCLYSGGKKVLTDHQDISGKVPTSRTINGKALSADVTLDADDIGQSAITKTGVETVDDALGSLSQQIGNVPLPTTAQTLTGAIKENSDKISDLGPVNNLTSDSTTAALSAAQGKALYDYILPYISTPTTPYHLTNITTISNAFTAGSVRILQLGKICVCIINWLIGSAIPMGTLLTVPETIKPVSGITFDFGAGHGYFELTTNGDLVCYGSPTDYGTWLNQSFTYFTR